MDISKGLTISHMTTHPASARYPDASAITYDEHNFKVTVVYNDHSIYVWDVRDIKKVSTYRLQSYKMSHQKCTYQRPAKRKLNRRLIYLLQYVSMSLTPH